MCENGNEEKDLYRRVQTTGGRDDVIGGLTPILVGVFRSWISHGIAPSLDIGKTTGFSNRNLVILCPKKRYRSGYHLLGHSSGIGSRSGVSCGLCQGYRRQPGR